MTALAGQVSAGEIQEAALRAWEMSGETVTAVEWSQLLERLPDVEVNAPWPEARCAIVASLRTVECIFDQAATVELARDAMSQLAETGWNVNVLLPVGLLGEAHELLRGRVMKLHGAWASGVTVHFTAPQTP